MKKYNPKTFKGHRTDGLALCKCGWYAIPSETAHYHYQKFTHHSYEVSCANPNCNEKTEEYLTKEESFEAWNNMMNYNEEVTND